MEVSNRTEQLAPIFSESSEYALLCMIFQEPQLLTEICDYLNPEQLYRNPYKSILKAAMSIFINGGAVDVIAVYNWLQKRSLISEIENELPGNKKLITFLNSLLDQAVVASVETAQTYMREIASYDKRRRLRHAASHHTVGPRYAQGDDEEINADDLILEANEIASHLLDNKVKLGLKISQVP